MPLNKEIKANIYIYLGWLEIRSKIWLFMYDSNWLKDIFLIIKVDFKNDP